MEITNFISGEVLTTFAMTIVVIELWVMFTKELSLLKKIHTRLYTLILAVIHMLIINTNSNLFAWNTIGVYTLLCNALIISVILCGGYDVITKKITINGKENKEDING